MSSKRSLVSRARQRELSSQTPRSRPRNSEVASAVDTPPLPPYQQPSCPLSAAAGREIEALGSNHDYTKYKKHIKASISILTNSAVESNDRLSLRKQRLERLANKRRQQGMDDEGKGDDEIEAEQFTGPLEKKVNEVTEKADKALRDLIDYQREIEIQDKILAEVKDEINAVPRRQYQGNDLDGNDEDDEGQDENTISAVELFKLGKGDYYASYGSKSMLERYDTNDFRNFKRTVHDALHPGNDAPPLPPARMWFAEDTSAATPRSRRRRQANTTDHTNNGSDEDNDVVIARVNKSFKCPLTLRRFEQPYSNNVCNHTFEKQAIVDYVEQEGVAFVERSQRRGRVAQPVGPKQVKCPQTGCDAMLELKDFYDDEAVRRQIQRQQKQAAAADLSDDEGGARGTDQRRAEEIYDGADDTMDVDADRRRTIAKVKKERASSLGNGMARGRGRGRQHDSDDEDDDDEENAENAEEGEEEEAEEAEDDSEDEEMQG